MQGSEITVMAIARIIRRATVGFAVCILFSLPVSAVTVPGLYSVDVPVSGSQPNDLARGYADGLRKVFIRVSGSRDVLAQEGINALLSDAESLVQSYQYLGGQGGGNRLRMSFGAVGVNKALASVGAPVWGANRPLTLAWIAVESNGSRNLLHRTGENEQGSAWLNAFEAAAADRGLPINLPPQSFAGQRELMSDIWGQFASDVRAASGDLDHDLISLVRVRRSGGQWRAGWVFDGMGLDRSEQSVTAENPQALAAAVIGRWADLFAQRYAVDGNDVGESPQVDIVLHGVQDLEDYAAANNVIKNLSPVGRAGVSDTRNDRLTLRVAFSGEIEQLKQYIALDSRLVPLSKAEVSRLPSNTIDASADSATGSGFNSNSNSGAPPEQSEPIDESQLPAESRSEVAGSENLSLSYEPLSADQEEPEKAFESLYQVLHYRWQPASVIQTDSGE